MSDVKVSVTLSRSTLLCAFSRVICFNVSLFHSRECFLFSENFNRHENDFLQNFPRWFWFFCFRLPKIAHAVNLLYRWNYIYSDTLKPKSNFKLMQIPAINRNVRQNLQFQHSHVIQFIKFSSVPWALFFRKQQLLKLQIN